MCNSEKQYSFIEEMFNKFQNLTLNSVAYIIGLDSFIVTKKCFELNLNQRDVKVNL